MRKDWAGSGLLPRFLSPEPQMGETKRGGSRAGVATSSLSRICLYNNSMNQSRITRQGMILASMYGLLCFVILVLCCMNRIFTLSGSDAWNWGLRSSSGVGVRDARGFRCPRISLCVLEDDIDDIDDRGCHRGEMCEPRRTREESLGILVILLG